MNNFFQNLYSAAVELNHKNILSLADFNPEANFLDLGCDDGAVTEMIAKKIGTNKIYGVEIVDSRIKIAESRGINVHNFDLNRNFDFIDNFFGIVCANQVIEHIYNSDNFLSEIFRILKPGGYALVSTENASSWCNIFASLMGWQIFSLTNFSQTSQSIGNPLSLHRGQNDALKSWSHVRIYNIRGLKKYCEKIGFTVDDIKGAGYFPLPGILGNIDKTHCHFMTLKISKPAWSIL